MASFTVETRSGERAQVAAKDGVSLMRLIRRAGIQELAAQCGGSCACATCHVYVTWPEGVPGARIEPPENQMLSTAGHRGVNSRLSCQIKFNASLDGLHVTIAPEDLNDI